jgi:transposase
VRRERAAGGIVLRETSLSQAKEDEMPTTARREQGTTSATVMHLAFELGATEWKLGFTTGLGRAPRERVIRAGDVEAVEREIGAAKRRFGVAAEVRVVSCYEAGREGFWLHRWLKTKGIENQVIDSSSIEVNRRRRRRKTDKLDLKSLLRLLARWVGGEAEVWRVVRVPSVEAEDRRHLHRELEVLVDERTERSNRIRGLLATQGVRLDFGGEFTKQLHEVRLWDGTRLGPRLRDRLEREWLRRESVVEEIRFLEAEQRALVRDGVDDPALEQVRGLMKLRGIAIKSAWVFVMEFFSWRRFNNDKEVGALAGLAPAPYISGEEERSLGIEKAGNERVRTMATEIAWGWLRYQPESEIARWFERRFGNAGKRARRRGIVAVARKILVALRRYLEFGEIPKGACLKTG